MGGRAQAAVGGNATLFWHSGGRQTQNNSSTPVGGNPREDSHGCGHQASSLTCRPSIDQASTPCRVAAQ